MSLSPNTLKQTQAQARSLIDALRSCPEEILPPALKAEFERLLPRKIDEFRGIPENRDGRGVKHSVNQQIPRTLKRVEHAIEHAKNHKDQNIRAEARKLLRSVSKISFEELVTRTTRFAGALNRAGHRRKEQERLKNRKRWEVHNLVVTQLTSSDQLQMVGRRFENCVGRKRSQGSSYHRSMRDGSGEFYLIERDGDRIALMMIDTRDRKIREIEGPGGKNVELDRNEALEISRILQINGNDCEPFSQVGAYKAFLYGTPKASDWIRFEDLMYKCYFHVEARRGRRDKQEIIIHRCRPRHLPDGTVQSMQSSWSRFTRGSGRTRERFRHEAGLMSWDDGWNYRNGAMTLGEFLDLALRSPDLYETLREFLEFDRK